MNTDDVLKAVEWADKHVNAVQSPTATQSDFWYIAWDRVKLTRAESFTEVLLKAWRDNEQEIKP